MEKILVFNESLLTPYLKNFKNGACFDQDVISELLKDLFKPGNTYFTDRGPAETNPAVKQLIPYITVWRNAGVFVYERGSKGGENRLHKKLSLGIGGHINPVDGNGLEAYEKAFWRELKEETELKRQQQFNILDSIRGLIYDSSDLVGQVHFGIIHTLDLKLSETMYIADPAVVPVGFMDDDQLGKRFAEFENWSKITMRQFMRV